MKELIDNLRSNLSIAFISKRPHAKIHIFQNGHILCDLKDKKPINRFRKFGKLTPREGCCSLCWYNEFMMELGVKEEYNKSLL